MTLLVRTVAQITASLPTVSLFICILWTMFEDSVGLARTHCNVPNYIPSLSASVSIGLRKRIWIFSIGISCILRLYIHLLYNQSLADLLTPVYSPKSILLNAHFWVHYIEICSLFLLTIFTSVENFPVHRNSFGTFVLSCAFFGLLDLFLLGRLQKSCFLSLSRKRKSRFYAAMTISIFISALCYVAHNHTCFPHLYSLFALTEYAFILTNVAYHYYIVDIIGKTGNQITIGSDADAHRGLRNMLFHHRADPVLSSTSSLHSKDEEKNLALLRYLLRFSVTEVDKIQWTNTTFDKRHMCFWFLFEQLKRYYFPAIFPKISAKYSIYDDGLLPSIISNPSDYSPIPDTFTLSVDRIVIYQEETVRWLTDFLYTGPRALLTRMRSISSTSDLRSLLGNESGSVKNPNSSEGSTSGIDIGSQSEVQRSNVLGQDRRTLVHAAADSPISPSFVDSSTLQQNPQASNLASVQRQQHRNSATSMNVLPIVEIRQTVPGYFAEHVVMAPTRIVLLEPVLPNIPEFSLEYSPRMVSRVRDILFNSRANVNCVHAVLHHASLLPLDRYKAHLCLALIYRTWLDEKPVFMKASSEKRTSKSVHCQNVGNNSNLKDMRRRRDLDLSLVLPNRSLLKTNDKITTSSPSKHSEVGGCAQRTFQTMFTNLAHIFLRTCPPAKEEDLALTDRVQMVMVNFVGQQISLCTLILNTIIQPLTQLNELNTESWEKLLFTLMHIISEVMSKIYQTDNFDSHWVSNDKLLGKMFQTLNTSCIYATLATPISSTTWDKCLSIYSRLPDCPALFKEWKKTMDLLTLQLGRIVFGVDLSDLPDESKTNRGRRGLGKAGMLSQPFGVSRLVTLRERRSSGDDRAAVGPTNSLQLRIPDKPRVSALESPGFNESNSGVEFGLTLGSDEADGVSSDGGAECLSATDGVEVRNSFDCGSSDIDFYIQKNESLLMDSQRTSGTTKEEDEGVALPSSLGSNNESNRLINHQLVFTPSDNPVSGYVSECDHVPPPPPPSSTNGTDNEPPCGKHRKVPRMNRLSENDASNTQLNKVSGGEVYMVSDSTLTRMTNQECSSQSSTLTKPLQEYSRGNSVLAGGKELGWNIDSTVVCWRRFLGLLGDFSQLSNPTAMAEVFSYLDSLTNSLLAIDAYQALVVTKSGSVKPPSNHPPLDYLVPVYLKVLHSSNEYIEAKKVVVSILKKTLITHRDVEPSGEMLAQFYRILHILLTDKSYKFANEVIRSDCGRLFSYSLPGSSLLVLDFIQAADEILSSSAIQNEALRAQAMSVIVSLLPFLNHFGSFEALDPTTRDLKVKDTDDIIPLLTSRLFRGVVAETSERTRQVALCGLLTLCYTNLQHISRSRFISAERTALLRTCLVTLLRCARISNRAVALTAISMLHALTECSDMVLDINPTYPLLIIQTLAWNLAFLWSQTYTEEKISSTFKMLLTANISALIGWTVKIPLPILTSPFVDLNKSAQSSTQDRSKEVTCLWVVFSVLEFICSSFTTSFQLEPSGLSWVPGCPIADPLADEVEGKVSDELKPSTANMDPHSNPIEMFSDQALFLAPAPLTPDCIRVAARFARCQLFYQLGRYPLSSTNDVLDSLIQEHHGRMLAGVLDNEELSFESVDQPDVQMFVINRSFLLSILAVEPTNTDRLSDSVMKTHHLLNNGALREEVVTDSCDVRIIIRDIAGKYVWDATQIYGLVPEVSKKSSPYKHTNSNHKGIKLSDTFVNAETEADSKTKLDLLAQLLEDLVSQHPELKSHSSLYEPDTNVNGENSGFEETSLFEKCVTDQVLTAARNERRVINQLPEIPSLPFYGTDANDPADNEEMKQWAKLNRRYTVVKQLLSQLGFLSQSRRPSIELLKKSLSLVREIKNLDKQRPRQTYKLAVVYIGPGQEDKRSILSNPCGSIEFERFVSALGWSVKLAAHRGFKGGLQYPEDGDIATYFANPIVEVIFHVATQMPSVTEEDRHRMFKHLGNDEVMIIWTEHWRAFRRSSLRTEFGDVLIIISPLSNGLFRVEIRKEPEIPFFGPLIDGMLVSEEHLPFLVRATAIQASNAINSRKPNFKEQYEERANYLQTIISNHIQNSSFEDFVMQVALPKPLPCQDIADRHSRIVPLSGFSTTIPNDVESLRSPNAPLKDTSPIVRIRRHMRIRSDSACEQEPVGVDTTNNEKHNQRTNSLHIPEIAATHQASVDAVDPVTSTDVPLTQAVAPAPSYNLRDQPRGLFSRISLRHKRRSSAVQGHRTSAGRVLNP
nr:ral GTPase activating protein subunit [Hymenolepis microstoma]